MERLKHYIKKHFTSFSFFYAYLRSKILAAFIISVFVGFIDGLGLTMFVPLLQVVSGDESHQNIDIGRMQVVYEKIENLGIPLTLGNILILMLVFFSLKGLAFYINQVYIVILQQRFIRKVRLDLIHLLNQLRFKHFITSNVGRIQNTMSAEVERVSQGFQNYFKALQYAVMVFVYLGFAFVVDIQFALLVAFGGFLTNYLYKTIYRKTKGASRDLTRFNSIFQGQIIQHISHFKYLRSTGTTQTYAEKLEETIRKIEKSRKRLGVLGSISGAIREPLLVAVIVVVIFVQVRFLNGNLGAIIVSLLLFYRALMALTNMQNFWNKYLEVSGSIENVQHFKKELQENQEEKGKKQTNAFQKEIRLEHLSFSYGKTPILQDISLRIQRNQSVAFVGESGSGKTTLVNLISGLLEPNQGELLIDGVPLQELDKGSFQSQIGYVTQDPVIFNDSIYNNVTFWDAPLRENLARFQASVQQAALDRFIADLPDKENTALGHSGINLSGGQKQRISIARELYKNSRILILDEATSALDSETEDAIQKSIDALKGQFTLLIVAHRLSTIKNADQIIFLQKGRIADAGNFQALMKRQPQFKRMVELQEL